MLFLTPLQFKYATWNIRGLGEKEEELDKILNENNIKMSVITESKKKLQGTKETEHYTVLQIWFRIISYITFPVTTLAFESMGPKLVTVTGQNYIPEAQVKLIEDEFNSCV